MSGDALGLALGAAFLHALWNVRLAGSRDSVAATGALLLFGAGLLTPAALFAGDVSSSAIPFIAASAVLELVYFGGLTETEAADVLSASRSTVAREARSAKAWLYRRMTTVRFEGSR